MCVSDINCGLGCYGTRLVRWGDDLISEPADYNDELFNDKLMVRAIVTTYERERHQKISLLQVLLPIRAIYMILRSFLPHYRSVLSVTTTQNPTNLLVAPNRDLVKSKRKGRQDDSKRRFEIYTLHKFHKMWKGKSEDWRNMILMRTCRTEWKFKEFLDSILFFTIKSIVDQL